MGYVLLAICWAIGAYGSYHCLWAAVGRKRYEFWMSKNEVKKTSIEMMALAIVMPFFVRGVVAIFLYRSSRLVTLYNEAWPTR